MRTLLVDVCYRRDVARKHVEYTHDTSGTTRHAVDDKVNSGEYLASRGVQTAGRQAGRQAGTSRSRVWSIWSASRCNSSRSYWVLRSFSVLVSFLKRVPLVCLSTRSKPAFLTEIATCANPCRMQVSLSLSLLTNISPIPPVTTATAC